jgi:hypothetical protein
VDDSFILGRHPEFHHRLLGLIPKCWEVFRLGEEVDIEHGFAFDGRLFSEKPFGPRLLVPGNFHREGGLYFDQNNTKYYAGAFPKETLLSNGDVLVVMTDLSPMTLILGRTVILNEPFQLLHNQRIGKFRFRRPDDWNPAFFALLMNDRRLRHKVIREASGTTVRHTSPERIESGLGLRPMRVEQDSIVGITTSLESNLRVAVDQKNKLCAVKAGLASDLLTGRVCIPEAVLVMEAHE